VFIERLTSSKFQPLAPISGCLNIYIDWHIAGLIKLKSCTID
jgi:hypothetical protein